VNIPEREATSTESASLASEALIERHSGTVAVQKSNETSNSNSGVDFSAAARPAAGSVGCTVGVAHGTLPTRHAIAAAEAPRQRILPPRPSGIGPNVPDSGSGTEPQHNTHRQSASRRSEPTNVYGPSEFAELLRTSREMAQTLALPGATPGAESAAIAKQAPLTETQDLLVASMPPADGAYEQDGGVPWDPEPWEHGPNDPPRGSTGEAGTSVHSNGKASVATRDSSHLATADADADATNPGVQRPHHVPLDDALQPRVTPRRTGWYRHVLELLVVGCLACVGFVAIDTKVQVTELTKRMSSTASSVATDATQTVSGESAGHRSRQTIRLSIEVTPPEAQLFLDDEPALNPLQLAYPSDDSPHEIRAEASGYLTRAVTVGLDQDVLVVLALVPEFPSNAPAPP
jgi:hypothetical protein